MEDIKYLIDTYGFKITIIVLAIFGCIVILKVIMEKIFENYISNKGKRKIVNLENEFQRQTIAYKILLEKELSFYEKYFEIASDLVTDIQDAKYNLNNSNFNGYKKYTINVLQIIPKIKKESLLYESYCDKNISIQIAELIVILQDEFVPVIDDIYKKKSIKGRNNDLDNICDRVLMQLALISTLISEREKKMSGQL